MSSQIRPRCRHASAALPLAAVVGAWLGSAGRPCSAAEPSTRPSLTLPTFPPPPAADTADPPPTSAAVAAVDKLVKQLASTDPEVADVALWSIEGRPYTDLPLLEAAAARPDLPPAAAERLGRVMPRIRLRDRLARRRAHALDAAAAFYERQALADYAAGGHTNPKWDDAAVSFLHLTNIRHALHRPAAVKENLDEARRQMGVVLAAGCDDPTVLACAGLLTVATGGGIDDAANLFDRSYQAQPPAGPLFRAIVADRLLRRSAKLDDAARRKAWPDLMNRLNDLCHNTKLVAAVPGVPPEVVDVLSAEAFERVKDVRVILDPPMGAFMPVVRDRLPNDPGMLWVVGTAHVEWAWQARGGGWANTVTPQGAKDMADRLAIAEPALTKSWQLDPEDPRAATEMLNVVLGQGDGRPAMEQWFARAMAADPDNVRACRAKLLFLEPKWFGDPTAMLQFGHECLDGGNWRGRIPEVLVDAHRAISAYVADPAAYWLLPGVWDDVRPVYDGFLRRDPTDLRARNGLAALAVKCHQWRVANDQLTRLGPAANAALFGNGSHAALDDARDTAARLADDPAAQGR
jgi:hypothetical protein